MDARELQASADSLEPGDCGITKCRTEYLSSARRAHHRSIISEVLGFAMLLGPAFSSPLSTTLICAEVPPASVDDLAHVRRVHSTSSVPSRRADQDLHGTMRPSDLIRRGGRRVTCFTRSRHARMLANLILQITHRAHLTLLVEFKLELAPPCLSLFYFRGQCMTTRNNSNSHTGCPKTHC